MAEDKPETTPSGSPIYRHKRRERESTAPQHHAEHLEEIEAHIQKYIGKVETVFHEGEVFNEEKKLLACALAEVHRALAA